MTEPPSTAWGYRLRASARYPGLLAGADFIPTIRFGHDVEGWSHDGTFSEGRKTFSLSLRGEYQKRYFADLTYVTFDGGDYDELRDRDYLSLAVGYSFKPTSSKRAFGTQRTSASAPHSRFDATCTLG